jgi:hypothetical protein
MLPIYQACNFDHIVSGGSTRPWQVLVSVQGNPIPFIVKLYKKDYIDQFKTVAKEVYSSVLANKLGIKTPTPALIEFPNDFISTLPSNLQEELYTKDQRLKFGTHYIQSSYQYQNTLHPLAKFNNIERIYAFDNLIKNGDRKVEKPNVLLKGNDIYVIDHEVSFAVDKSTIDLLNENKWIYDKENHIFYRHLKDKNVSEKKTMFKDFSDSLSELDFSSLDPYYEQLRTIGHDTQIHYLSIKDYLCAVQRNREKFVQLVLAHLG